MLRAEETCDRDATEVIARRMLAAGAEVDVWADMEGGGAEAGMLCGSCSIRREWRGG